MTRNSRRVAVLAIAGAVAIVPVISGCGAGSEPQTAAPTQLTEAVNVTVPKDRPAAAKIDVRNLFLLGPRADMAFGQGSSVPLYATVINQVKGAPDRLVGVASPDFAQVKITGGAVELPAAKPSGEGSAVRLVGQAASPAPATSPATSGKPAKKPGGTATASPSGSPSASPSAQPSGQSTAPAGQQGEQPGGGQASAKPGGASASPSGTASPGASPSGTAQPAAPPAAPPAADGKAPLVVLTGLTKQLLGGERVTVRLQFERAGSVEVSVPVIPQQGEFASYAAVSAGTPAPGASAAPGTESEHGAGEHASAEPAPGATGAPSAPAPGTSEPASGTPAPAETGEPETGAGH